MPNLLSPNGSRGKAPGTYRPSLTPDGKSLRNCSMASIRMRPNSSMERICRQTKLCWFLDVWSITSWYVSFMFLRIALDLFLYRGSTDTTRPPRFVRTLLKLAGPSAHPRIRFAKSDSERANIAVYSVKDRPHGTILFNVNAIFTADLSTQPTLRINHGALRYPGKTPLQYMGICILAISGSREQTPVSSNKRAEPVAPFSPIKPFACMGFHFIWTPRPVPTGFLQ